MGESTCQGGSWSDRFSQVRSEEYWSCGLLQLRRRTAMDTRVWRGEGGGDGKGGWQRGSNGEQV